VPRLRSLPSRERSSCYSRFKSDIVIIELSNSLPIKNNLPASKIRWRKTSRHCRLPSKRSVRKFPLRHRPRQHRSRYAFHLRHPNRYNRPRNNDGFATAIGPPAVRGAKFRRSQLATVGRGSDAAVETK
jgi:hypothetical protein